MSIGTVFVNNRTQAIRLPLDVRLWVDTGRSCHRNAH